MKKELKFLTFALLTLFLAACSDSDKGGTEPSLDIKSTTEYKSYGLERFGLKGNVKEATWSDYQNATWDKDYKRVIAGEATTKTEREFNNKGLLVSEVISYRDIFNPGDIKSDTRVLIYDSQYRLISNDSFRHSLSGDYHDRTTYDYNDALGKVRVEYSSRQGSNELTSHKMEVYTLDKNGRIDFTQIVEYYKPKDETSAHAPAMTRAAMDNTEYSHTGANKYYQELDSKDNFVKYYNYTEYSVEGANPSKSVYNYQEQSISYFDGTQSSPAKVKDDNAPTYFVTPMAAEAMRGKVKSEIITSYTGSKWNQETQTLTEVGKISAQYTQRYSEKGYLQESSTLNIYWDQKEEESSRATISSKYESDAKNRTTSHITEWIDTRGDIPGYRLDKVLTSYDDANKKATRLEYLKRTENGAEVLESKIVYNLEADGMTALSYDIYLPTYTQRASTQALADAPPVKEKEWELDYTTKTVEKLNANGEWIELLRIHKYAATGKESVSFQTRVFTYY